MTLHVTLESSKPVTRGIYSLWSNRVDCTATTLYLETLLSAFITDGQHLNKYRVVQDN